MATGQAGPSPAPSLWDLLGWDWLPLQRLQVSPGGPLQRVALSGSRYGLSPLVPLGSGLTTAPHHCWSKETSPPLWFLASAITCANRAVDKPCSPSLSRLASAFLAPHSASLPPSPYPSLLCIISLIAHPLPKMVSCSPLPVFNPAHSRTSSSLTSSRCRLRPAFTSPRISPQEFSSYFLVPSLFPVCGFYFSS